MEKSYHAVTVIVKCNTGKLNTGTLLCKSEPTYRFFSELMQLQTQITTLIYSFIYRKTIVIVVVNIIIIIIITSIIILVVQNRRKKKKKKKKN